jgi:hypothetical protein
MQRRTSWIDDAIQARTLGATGRVSIIDAAQPDPNQLVNVTVADDALVFHGVMDRCPPTYREGKFLICLRMVYGQPPTTPVFEFRGAATHVLAPRPGSPAAAAEAAAIAGEPSLAPPVYLASDDEVDIDVPEDEPDIPPPVLMTGGGTRLHGGRGKPTAPAALRASQLAPPRPPPEPREDLALAVEDVDFPVRKTPPQPPPPPDNPGPPRALMEGTTFADAMQGMDIAMILYVVDLNKVPSAHTFSEEGLGRRLVGVDRDGTTGAIWDWPHRTGGCFNHVKVGHTHLFPHLKVTRRRSAPDEYGIPQIETTSLTVPTIPPRPMWVRPPRPIEIAWKGQLSRIFDFTPVTCTLLVVGKLDPAWVDSGKWVYPKTTVVCCDRTGLENDIIFLQDQIGKGDALLAHSAYTFTGVCAHKYNGISELVALGSFDARMLPAEDPESEKLRIAYAEARVNERFHNYEVWEQEDEDRYNLSRVALIAKAKVDGRPVVGFEAILLDLRRSAPGMPLTRVTCDEPGHLGVRINCATSPPLCPWALPGGKPGHPCKPRHIWDFVIVVATPEGNAQFLCQESSANKVFGMTADFFSRLPAEEQDNCLTELRTAAAGTYWRVWVQLGPLSEYQTEYVVRRMEMLRQNQRGEQMLDEFVRGGAPETDVFSGMERGVAFPPAPFEPRTDVVPSESDSVDTGTDGVE